MKKVIKRVFSVLSLKGLRDQPFSTKIDIEHLMMTMAHELKTPLSILRSRWEMELLNDDISLPFRRRLVDDIEELSRLNRVINDFLQMIRLESHRVCLSSDRINLTELLLEVIELIDPLMKDKGVVTKFVAAQDYFVIGDRLLLFQALLNIIENGVKYTSIESHLSLSIFKKNGKILIMMDDDGPGISQEDLPHIFDLFYRSQGLGVTGSGIGLFVAKSIINAHHGDIFVSNIEPKGCRFSIELKGV